jgi:hypothetical protein
VAQHLVSLANYALASDDSLIVVICLLFPRRRADRRFKQRITQANTEVLRLVRLVHSCRLTAVPLRGLCNPDPDIFLADGVHFNYLGNRKFFRGVRGALIRAFKHASEATFPSWMPSESLA